MASTSLPDFHLQLPQTIYIHTHSGQSFSSEFLPRASDHRKGCSACQQSTEGLCIVLNALSSRFGAMPLGKLWQRLSFNDISQ
ncbi:hypothetical protein GN956_G23240 [Arapaima gigas]